ncbi:MAG: peptidoglycan editing factor PgeF [Herpetosiphonaceae bacterium]|nr:peptidoglycan editing factor PgeF [Herpetosiphonaceae bacterium]
MLIRFPSFDHPDLVHAVTTRAGGVSQAPYASLNLSWTRPDEPAAVLENRRRLCSALEIPLGNLVQAGQIHGIGVRAVGRAERGAGARERATVLPPADALMTDVPEVYLLACFADCVPLLFFDPVRRAVAVAHAGWRGTVKGMAAATVAAMTARYGSQPENLQVVIGPSAGPCCYTVGSEVVDAVKDAFPKHPELLVAGDDGPRFDLWAANRVALFGTGVRAAAISVSGECTIHQCDRFFSHRATGGATGRIAAVIGLRDPQGALVNA